MPGDIRSFFGGASAKKPPAASPKPDPAAKSPAAKPPDVAAVDLTDDPAHTPPRPSPGAADAKRKADDAVDVRPPSPHTHASLPFSRARIALAPPRRSIFSHGPPRARSIPSLSTTPFVPGAI